MSSEGSKIRLLVCDDHGILNDAIAIAIRHSDDLELVTEPLTDPEAAVGACLEYGPDVVLMDVQFAESSTDGVEATRRIKDLRPETNVVIMTAHTSGRVLLEAVEAGASGILRKTEALQRLLDMARAAAAGEILVDPAELSKVTREAARARESLRDAERTLGELTARECEILQLLADGLRNQDVAARLVISPQTAQTHVRNILAKLGVRSRLEAVVFAAKHGIVTVSGSPPAD